MNGSEASEIVAKAQWEKHESKLDDRWTKIEKTLTRLVADYVTAKTRHSAMMTAIAEDLENIARAMRKLHEDELLPPPELSEEEIEDALEMHESMKQQAADHTREMAVAS